MNNRLILSELRLLLEHYTTSERPDPEFMRMHAMSLTSAIETWAAAVEGEATLDKDADPQDHRYAI
jgi:hypothetical protein